MLDRATTRLMARPWLVFVLSVLALPCGDDLMRVELPMDIESTEPTQPCSQRYTGYEIVVDEFLAWRDIGPEGAMACDVPAQDSSRYALPCCSEYALRSGAVGVSCLPPPPGARSAAGGERLMAVTPNDEPL